MSVCSQGHELKKTEPAELSKTSWQYSSYGYRCKKCNKSERNKWSWHCKICYYDLCPTCYVDGSSITLRCSSLQHTLTPCYTSSSYISCDSCKKKQSRNELVYSCRKCDYDLCTKCYQKMQPSKDSKKKLEKIYDKEYCDKKDNEIMSEEGTEKFFKDLGINAESAEPLMVAYHLKCDEMGIFSKEDFVNGFWVSGIKDKKQMKKVVSTTINSIKTSDKAFKQFYTWVFEHGKEDSKKRTIPTELAIQLWSIIFDKKRKKQMKYYSKWIDYCDSVCDDEMTVVSKDLWTQCIEFLKITEDISEYDDMYGWPVEIDEFVEWLNDNNDGSGSDDDE